MKARILKFLTSLVMVFALVLGLAGCKDDAGSQPEVERKEYTIAELREFCTPDGEVSKDRYYVRATVKSIDNPQYGQMTIKDSTGEVSVYGTYSADGEKRYPELEDKPVAGDEVLLYANVHLFKDEVEIKSGWIIEFKHDDTPFDDSKYEAMNIAAARNQEKGKLVKVTGVVAQITYANGKKPSGFYLVDNTNSIYVYDNQIAAQVKVGNTVTVAAEKDYWIKADEVESASKFGYKGCNQVTNCHLISLDKSVKDFDKSWIQERAIKDIIANEEKADISTTIFKVNGLVEKRQEPGFVNYYIYDIDGKTGSYVYTQCNGTDFAWLDEFDGKICTVYLSVMNAKSTASGIVYRFLPILVSDDNYKFDLTQAADYAIKYVALDQFGNDYQLDPKLELATSVKDEKLGIENVKLEYTSSNTNYVYFKEEAGKLIMHTNNVEAGSAEITIKATSGNATAEAKLRINVLATPKVEGITVKEAIDSAISTEVTVRGIVGASLVNQDGFYLIDETGVIAVKATTETLGTLKLGNEIVVKGNMAVWGKKDQPAYQLCIKDATVVLNEFGETAYSTASFIKGKTLADINALDINDVKQTASVYEVENCTIKITTTQHYSQIELMCGEATINLYSSSAKQYNWLKQFENQTITVHIAPCDWNSRPNYSGCVLAVVKADGTRVVNDLNFAK